MRGMRSLVEAGGVAAAAAGLGWLAIRIVSSEPSTGTLLVIPMLAAGYLVADAVTGAVHWFCDTFFEETTPLVGAAIIAPFREHHRDPLAMTRHGFLELVGSSCCLLAVVLGAYLWATWSEPRLAADAFLFALGLAGATTNLFHRWAHEPSAPTLARALQRSRLVLTPERHARHHAPPYAAAYCVTSGILNPLLDRWKVWERATRAARWFVG